MTIETYNRATKILEEKKQLEEELYRLRMSHDFVYNIKEYEDATNRLFALGLEFAAL